MPEGRGQEQMYQFTCTYVFILSRHFPKRCNELCWWQLMDSNFLQQWRKLRFNFCICLCIKLIPWSTVHLENIIVLQLSRTLRNPNVHRRFFKCPPLVPIQSQINPIHTLQSCFLKIRFLSCVEKNIIVKSCLSFRPSLRLSACIVSQTAERFSLKFGILRSVLNADGRVQF
jgi:hypothetical protein